MKEQIFFLKRLSFLLASGHSLYQSVLLIEDLHDKRSKNYQKLLELIAGGHLFSEALSDCLIVTDLFAIQLIALGEKTASLPHAVATAVEEIERKRLFANKLIGALLYPVCVVCGALSVSLALVFFVFPKVIPVFAGMGVALPLSTRILIGSITLVLQHWIMFIIFSLACCYGVWRLFRAQGWRILFIRYIWLSRILRSIGLVIEAGLTLDQGILFCAETLKQKQYSAVLRQFSDEVKKGKSIGELCTGQPFLFPPLIGSLVSVAERSGTLAKALLYLADFYAGEVELVSKKMTELIEPVLMIFLGLFIGFIGVSLIAPIYGLTQHVYQ
jgi:type II secretory pathway component PulF